MQNPSQIQVSLLCYPAAHHACKSVFLCDPEHILLQKSDHLSLVSPGPYGDLEGFMLHSQTSSK